MLKEAQAFIKQMYDELDLSTTERDARLAEIEQKPFIQQGHTNIRQMN